MISNCLRSAWEGTLAVIQNNNFFGSKDKLIGTAPQGFLHEDHRFRIETLNVVNPVWQDEPKIGDIVTATALGMTGG